jgi:DNA gyrase subunit B
MTELRRGKFDNNSYKISGGLHGVGVSVVNALSEWLRLTIKRDGMTSYLEFKDGSPLQSSRSSVKPKSAARKCTFLASKQTFSNIEYHYDIFAKRLRELSFLNNGLKITLVDQRTGKQEDFSFSGGIKGFVEYMNRSKTVLHQKIFFAGAEKEGIIVEVAMQWNDSYAESVLCFTNNIPQATAAPT